MCKGEEFLIQNEPINGDMWIQALTYFRDQQEAEPQLILALKEIRERNILSPLLVLAILKRNQNLPFRILKSFLLENLKTQQKRIDKHNSRLNEEMTKIRNCKSEIAKMKQTAIDFNNKKTCDLCKRELNLPTVHFMCKHTYCESCVDDVNGIRKCPNCNEHNKYLFEIRATYAQNRHDTENFFRELQGAGQGDSNKTKFDVIAGYCNKDLFSGINDPQEESKTQR